MPDGLAMTRMPRKPMTTALQRWMPTFSPRSGTESAVRKMGEAKEIATASAIGNRL